MNVKMDGIHIIKIGLYAKKITKILVDELGLKGIIVGRKGCEKDINIKNIKN